MARVLTQEDIKRILGIGQDELENLMARGLPCYFEGNSFFFDSEAAERWLVKRIDLGITKNTLEDLKALLGFASSLKFPPTYKVLNRLSEGNYPKEAAKYCENLLSVENRASANRLLMRIDPNLTASDCDKVYLAVVKHLLEIKFQRN